jgi:hypothetical protein
MHTVDEITEITGNPSSHKHCFRHLGSTQALPNKVGKLPIEGSRTNRCKLFQF